jgi:hypothetical protein
MADVTHYKRQIQEAADGASVKGTKSNEGPIVRAFRAINADGPSALTFYGLKESAYVKRGNYIIQMVGDEEQHILISMDSNTLEYRMNELILKIKKTDEPADAKWIPDEAARKSQADMLLTAKGIRKITGALNEWPGV